MIALLCSVQAEAALLLAKAGSMRRTALGCKTIIEGTIGAQNIILSVGGMGKANAAHAATILLTRYHPRAFVIFGVGGAYPASGAAIGDLALATEEIAGDEGVLTSEGFRDTAYIGIPLLKTAHGEIYNTYPAPESLLKQTTRVLGGGQGHAHVGSFVTVSTCTGTIARARELEARYKGLCENMEGAAAAHVAVCHNVPWLEVRGISNIVEDRDLTKWNIPKAAEAVQKAVIQILQNWEAA